MANPFDQFDGPATPAPAAQSNPFDQFEASAAPGPSWTSQETAQGWRRGADGKVEFLRSETAPASDGYSGSYADPDGVIRQHVAIYGTGKPVVPENPIDKLPASSRPGLTDTIVHGMTLGLDTEADGLATAAGNLIAHPVQAWNSGGQSVSDAYHQGRDENLARLDYVNQHNPIASKIADFGGMVLSPIGAPKAVATGFEGLKTLAKSGAIIGGLSGFEEGDGTVGQRLESAAVGSGVGAVAAPLIGHFAGGVAGLAGDVVNHVTARRAAVTGADLVAQKLAEDNITPADAAQALGSAQANGTPAVLADLGENTRAFGGSVSRQPGAARNVAKTVTAERQLGQGERIKDAINRDLGHTTDVLEESERLIEQAKAKASPLYEKAYAQPTNSDKIQGILKTPAARGALKRAYNIAANEGIDPHRLGIDLDMQGEPTLTRVPTTQTLDYVKRGLDDIIEKNRSPLTGKLILDESGKAVNGVKQRLLAEMDRLNPDYKAARAAYAGPAKLREAMMDGKAALNKSAAEINQRLKNMTPAEHEQYALGLRSAIADKLESGADNSNKVRQLVANPKKRAALQQVFGGRSNLDRFLATLDNEQKAFETYAAVHRGSPTAERRGEDAHNSDIKLIHGFVKDGAELVGGGHLGFASVALRRAGDAVRYGVGKAGQRAREDAASLLFSSNPSEFTNAMAQRDASVAARNHRLNVLMELGNIGGGKIAAAGGAASSNALLGSKPPK